VIVNGVETVTFAPTETYYGSTTISGGTLDVTGALLNSSSITVNGTSNSPTLVLGAVDAVPTGATITGSAGSGDQSAPDYRYLVVPLRALTSA